MKPIPVPGFEGLFVNEHGEVFELEQGMLTSLAISATSTYARVSVRTPQGRRREHVHVLMALAFLGLEPSQRSRRRGGAQVDHLDGNKLNNCLSNLEVVTKEENLRRAWVAGAYAKNGYASKGKAKPTLRRFSAEQVDEMKSMRLSGTTYRAIAKHFKCDHKAVYRILRGETYQQ